MTVNKTQTVSGTSIADAAAMLADHVQIPSATAGQGLLLRAGVENDIRSVCNKSAVDIKLYPPSSAGSINSGAAGFPLILPPSGAVMVVCIDAHTYHAVKS